MVDNTNAYRRNKTNLELLLFAVFRVLIIPIFIISCSNQSSEKKDLKKPNIILLVADDLGYADLGSYGGNIETPNIDALALSGIRFSRFHTSPLCAPTRAMLLTGNDNHIAGMGNMLFRNNDFGYEGRLTDRIATVPALLRDAGYHTYMAGKWHLGRDSVSNPAAKGFEHSFVNLLGAGNHYDDTGFDPAFPITPYTEDGKPATWQKGNYSTDFYTDKIIEYIDINKNDDKPFFVFAAYTSPHWPLQVDEQYWKKYEGRYDEGYEKLREKRLVSLKNTGMIPKDAVLPPLNERVKPWNSLTKDEKKKEARKMELYAGMVDNLDHNIGRLVQHLKAIGQFENTLIVFMSDNGAAAEDFYYNDHFRPQLVKHFNDDYEDMGKPNSFISYGPQWAEAGTSPFRYFKGYTTEGGINTPMIITGPGIERKNEISDRFVTLMDIAPTFYELAGVQYPEVYNGHTIYPLKGNSLMNYASGKTNEVHSPEYVFALEHDNDAMIRKGDWKITNMITPFNEENFHLYNLSNDLAESRDLKNEKPEKYNELINEWRKFTKDIKVNFANRSSED